ncbi:YbaB/EbfC family nucleoid-associated protein [Streptomyces sp. NPDC093970]|uniref:YbaB/EbfC family nucleoid-associated protein n=1 Tax=Streptomyces sp. NPDC093970 TaxID=3155076 RepID=UPI00343A3CC4
MTESLGGNTDDLFEAYRARRAEAEQLQKRVRETTASVVAPRQVVKVTVGSRGELTAVEFPTGAYRRLTPAELAEVLMTSVREAQEKVADEVSELLAPHLPAELNVRGVLRGEANATSGLPDAPKMGSATRAYLEQGGFLSHS